MVSDEQIPDTAAAGDSSRRSSFSAIVNSRVATEMHGEENRAVVRFSEEHVSALIELQAKEQESSDRHSERESGERKEARRLTFALAIIAIIAVVGIIIFLVIYDEGKLLGYILSGIGGLLAGAFGGYGYANTRGRQ